MPSGACALLRAPALDASISLVLACADFHESHRAKLSGFLARQALNDQKSQETSYRLVFELHSGPVGVVVVDRDLRLLDLAELYDYPILDNGSLGYMGFWVVRPDGQALSPDEIANLEKAIPADIRHDYCDEEVCLGQKPNLFLSFLPSFFNSATNETEAFMPKSNWGAHTLLAVTLFVFLAACGGGGGGGSSTTPAPIPVTATVVCPNLTTSSGTGADTAAATVAANAACPVVTLTSVTPTDGATGVKTNVITTTFNGTLNGASITGANVKVRVGGVEVPVVISTNGTTGFRITANGPLALFVKHEVTFTVTDSVRRTVSGATSFTSAKQVLDRLLTVESIYSYVPVVREHYSDGTRELKRFTLVNLGFEPRGCIVQRDANASATKRVHLPALTPTASCASS